MMKTKTDKEIIERVREDIRYLEEYQAELKSAGNDLSKGAKARLRILRSKLDKES